MEGWRLKDGWSSLRCDSPWHSPNTYSLVVQFNNPVVETSAGEPLISMRPFAVTKCSAWLLSKEPLRLWDSKPSYTEFCYSIASHPPVVVSLQYSTQKTLRLQKPSLPNIMGRLNNRAGMSPYGQVIWGVQRVASEPLRAPGCHSTLCRRLSEATLLSDGDLRSRLLRSHPAR